LFDGPTLAFKGVRVFAFDRQAMLNGDPATAIAFTVPLAGVGRFLQLCRSETFAQAIRRCAAGMRCCWPSIARPLVA
jgi:hypothetical protein